MVNWIDCMNSYEIKLDKKFIQSFPSGRRYLRLKYHLNAVIWCFYVRAPNRCPLFWRRGAICGKRFDRCRQICHILQSSRLVQFKYPLDDMSCREEKTGPRSFCSDKGTVAKQRLRKARVHIGQVQTNFVALRCRIPCSFSWIVNRLCRLHFVPVARRLYSRYIGTSRHFARRGGDNGFFVVAASCIF